MGAQVDLVTDPLAQTPWQERGGIWYKREDLHGNAYGVSGAKYRAGRHLMSRAVLEGAEHVVSASSVLSPQAAISATLAEELGLGCTILLGATYPESAVKHPSVAVAVAAGAMLDTSTKVAYNPQLQKRGAELTAAMGPDTWQMPYGITTPAGYSPEDVRSFLEVGGAQTKDFPASVETLVLPFGSGNTAAGVVHGLATHDGPAPRRLALVGVGPDRLSWLMDRLAYVGLTDLPFEISHMPLHPWFATYGDRMRETLDGIVMHPTYEGKVVRFLNTANPDWWAARDGSVGFWIVGGTL